MTDKLVITADLNTLDEAFRWIDDVPVGQESIRDKRRILELLTRLIAAAEADQPPLPEGWVVMNAGMDGHVSQGVFWHRDGLLYQWSDDETAWGAVDANKDRLTPLRPTVTSEDVEKAAQAAAEESASRDVWRVMPEGMQSLWRSVTRAAFDAVGIEVQS